MADDAADDRWTVRGIPKTVREAVTASAQRRKLSVGEWACEAFDRHLQAEREPFEVLPGQSDKPSAVAVIPSDGDVELARVERAVAAAVALAGAEAVPVGFRRAANRLLRASLPELPPRARKGQAQLRLAGGTDAA